MTTAALAVGLAVTGGVALLIAFITILFCVLHKQTPNRNITSRSTNSQNSKSPRKRVIQFKTTSKSTERIKKKAEQLKAKKQRSCCAAFWCACCSKADGPLPDPPLGVEIKDIGETETTVTWKTPATENTSTILDGYKIYIRYHDDVDGWSRVAKLKATFTEYHITGLNPSKRYVAGVSSYSKTGESSITDTPTIILKREPVRPGAPTEVDIIDKTHNSITLSWKPPKKTGFCRIQTYHLMIKDFSNNTKWNHLSTVQAFDRYMDYRVTNLKHKNQYRFRINAENMIGIGPYAETSTVETLNAEPDPPDKPRGPILFSKITHNSITLSWRPPARDGGRPVSGYAIEYKEKDGARWGKAGVCEANINKFTVEKLHEDIDYVFRVIAMNDVGNSDSLVSVKAKTKLLEIPLSRRSSFRIPSRSGTGQSSRPQSIGDGLTLSRMARHPSVESLKNLDTDLEADPHVPKSDFFTYDETSTGNNSTRRGDKGRPHSSSSPLPLPPHQKAKKLSRRKRQHHDFSPLPVHSSVRMTNGYVYNAKRGQYGDEYGENSRDRKSGRSSGRKSGKSVQWDHNTAENKDWDLDYDESQYNARYSNISNYNTPSNVAFTFSHNY
ncbi:hypothetical protein ACF0H5_014008 [Mactra antiquata]